MKSLIENIKVEARSNRWANGKVAGFEYDQQNICYRVVELTPDLSNFIITPVERNNENCPSVAMGFVAFLIRNWGKNEVDIYNNYYSSCFANFECVESKKPGSFRRNLSADFFYFHLADEKKKIKFSEQIFPFISDEEVDLINDFVAAYFEFINDKYFPNKNKNAQIAELPDTLYEIFESTSKYKTVMEILVSKQFLHPQTYIWKDKKAGYKGLICAIMKDFEAKKYLKPEISMSWDLCKRLTNNSFKVKINGNKTYFNATLPPVYKDLIPFASTID